MIKTDDGTIGKRVAESRNQMSLQMVEREAGIKAQTILEIEAGRRHATLGELKMLACTLGVSVEAFFPEGKVPPDYD